MADKAVAGDPKSDARMLWIFKKMASSLTEVRYVEKLKIALFADENGVAYMKQFLDDANQQVLYFTGGGEKVNVAFAPPKQIKKKSILFLKPAKNAVKPETIEAQIVAVELSPGPLEQLSLIANEIFMPLMSHPECREQWSDTVQHDIMDKMHAFLSNLYVMIGSTKGETLLPLPPADSYSGDPATSKDRVHLLESAIVRWSKQITSVLRTDPDVMLTSGLDPDPLVELEFWIAKAKNLNSIFAQLESDKMKTILGFLAQSENAFGAQFGKLTADVLAARAEANENARYLNTLKPMLKELNTAPADFADVSAVFRPLMHCILQIWKGSKSYNTNNRLVCLIREICNALIRTCQVFVNGEKIFEAIEQNVFHEALQKLQLSLKIVADFKEIFAEYQKKAAAEIGPQAWAVAPKLFFLRLDAFTDRCTDIIEFVRIASDFVKLDRIFIGYTKGAVLTNTLRNIHTEFMNAMADFRAAPYDVMDVRRSEFDAHFFKFKTTVKQLEPRLAATVLTSYDDCPTVTACFKLLECYETLLDRPVVAEALEPRYTMLLRAYERDVLACTDLFAALKQSPPVHSNLPPISGALSWARGLKDRVHQPMEYMLQAPFFFERAEFKEVTRAHDHLLELLAKYETAKCAEWSAETQVSSQAKLKQPLLRRDPASRLLEVNFDKAVTRLLREVKYMLRMKLPVNDVALQIYHQEHTFRNHIANLDMVVSMYNEMLTTLLSVERPLVEQVISAIDETLEAGLIEHNWTSPNIQTYIQELLEMTRQVFSTVKTMKANLKEIERVLKSAASKPLLQRKVKPETAKAFNDNHAKVIAARKKEFLDEGESFVRILADTQKTLMVDSISPDWQNYANFVQQVIVEGLVNIVVQNMNYLSDQIDPAVITKKELGPLLTINLSLVGKEIAFLPFEDAELKGVEVVPKNADVWVMVEQWAESFLTCVSAVRRLESAADGTVDYANEIRAHQNVRGAQAKLATLLQDSRAVTEKLRTTFVSYAYLYTTDLNVAFAQFMRLRLALAKGMDEAAAQAASLIVPEGEEEEDFGQVPLKDVDGQIIRYKAVQTEVIDKPSPIECGWLRVSTQPVKAALTTWVGHWIHKYIQHLQGEVITKVKGLNDFMHQVKQGTKEQVKEGDTQRLREVLSYIHTIRTREKRVAAMWGPFQDMVVLLKKHGYPLDDAELKTLATTPQKWTNTVADIYGVQQSITHLQNAEVDNIRRDVENFTRELETFRVGFRKEAPFDWRDGLQGIESAYRSIHKFNGLLDEFSDRARGLREIETLFELNVSAFRDIALCRSENKFLKVLWDTVCLLYHVFESWKQILWDDIDSDALLLECKDLKQQLDEMPREMKSWKAYLGLQDQLKNLTLVLPLASILHSPNMKERHWEELAQVTKKVFNMGPTFCLGDLLKLELYNKVDDVEDIVEKSNKESKIDAQLNKIKGVWKLLALEFIPHKTGEVKLIRVPEDANQALEEHMVLLQGIQNQGKYVKFFEKTVALWMSNLGAVETVLRDWYEVQGKWASLETIFLGSADIRVQLPEDSKRFDTIDEDFRALMIESQHTPNVVDSATKTGRATLLENLKLKLEMCEKSLNNYLEAKKKIFPRFYFLSDIALLDILSNGNNPQKIQKHLADCFDNLQTLTFTKDAEGNPTKKAIGMTSKDGGEYVEFKDPMMCEGAVEDWLNVLVETMRATLKDVLGRSKDAADNWSVETPRTQWLYDFCAQLVVCTSQIMWTEEMNTAFDLLNANENAMRECVVKQNQQLDATISLVQGDLTPSDRVKIITLITIDVHSRDVTQAIIDQKIDNPLAFQWLSQMRYYWTSEKQCIMRICDAEFFYAFEFIGNPGRLVITPLTDRCYITLTQALRLIMGGAPAGPAGTGKTETTKDLGRGLALPVYVFNCSSQMNIYTLGDIFKGLCQSGGWGCFDEFNRIPIEVLSVVSNQVMTILQALRLQVTNKVKQSRFDFMGDDIRIISTVGVFITMNPGYAGRTELPESLKALFRPCAMVVPDFEMICENMLMSEGFLSARPLAKKIVTLYRLGADLLSKQAQYDWGLRAIKSVLRVAGGLKRAERQVAEDSIMMRALRDFNLPKIVEDDKSIFKRIIADLFPGFELAAKVDKNFNEWVKKCAVQQRMQPEESFCLKVVSLKELLEIRHSVFIIGPAGCGKSVVWNTLINVYNTIEKGGFEGSAPKTAVFETINPKAVTSDELFGWKTEEWHDGVLSVIMRDMARNNQPYTANQKVKFVLLDGDIDPEWIESLNTVMDDNKVLTLVSNERIPLTPAMRMVFEISHLKYATPATVSRAGILFISDRDIGWQPFMQTWIDLREDEKEKSTLSLMFNRYVKNNDVIEKVKREFKFVCPVSEIQLVQTICRSLEAFSDRIKSARTADWTAAFEKEVYECAFVFSCVWAYGGPLLVDKGKNWRDEFSTWWKREFPAPIKFGDSGSVFDYYPDLKTGKMAPWSVLLPKYQQSEADQLLVSNIYVPTIDTFRLTYTLDLFAKHRRPAAFVGVAGTGKTTIMREYLQSLSVDEYITATINFNSFTDSYALQTTMEQYVDKRSGRTYGPPPGKRLIYFIDDLNMPFVDKYGTQSPIELLIQHLNYGSFYDRKRLELKKEVKDAQYVACMNPTAGSFVVNDRVTRHFAIFSCLMPSVSDVKIIYKNILDDHFRRMDDPIKAMSEKLVTATSDLLTVVQDKFLPNSEKFMYQFNLRELCAVMQGICLSSGEKYNSNKERMVRLWAHECSRVFSDRLIVESDVELFKRYLAEKAAKHFEDVKLNPNDTLIFTSFVSDVPKPAGSAAPAANAQTVNGYVPVPSFNGLKDVLTDQLELYNDSNANMDLVLFEMAMEHVCRIARIINIPRGNALLVGVGGSGKQSLARLASFICGYKVCQIAVTATYGMNDFKAFLQDLYQRCAIKSEQLTFMLTDTQIVDERFLVYVNDLLSSGFIPDLFNNDERESIFQSMRKEFTENKVPEVKSRMNDFFVNKVRANLHVVLCFSPVGDAFRVRARKFPALVNCTAMDFFHGWPRQALETVALRFLQKIDIPDALRPPVSLHMAEVHTSVIAASAQYRKQERRYNYATPKSFLELINFYSVLLEVKRGEVNKKKDRLEKGLNILRNTASDVARLKEDLVLRLAQVEDKKASAAKLIVQIGQERQKVEKQQELAEIEAEKSKVIAAEASALKADCEAILGSALPKIAAAKAAVDALDKNSITNLAALAKPPDAVALVTRAVLILKEARMKSDWNDAKKMMKSVDKFLGELKAFGPEQVLEQNVTVLEAKIFNDPQFTYEAMVSVSTPAANLCAWVINTVGYWRVWKDTVPKQEAMAAATVQFENAQAKLAAVQAKVAEMQAALEALNDGLKKAVDEQAAVELEAKMCLDRLALAERLVNGLADENTRWGANVADLQIRLNNLTGDVLLGAAFVSYIGAFNSGFRAMLWQQKWLPDLIQRQIPLTDQIDPLAVLASDTSIAKWKNEGLPADRISLENGAIVSNCQRWPLMIDPQLQGVKWIKQRSQGLRTVAIGSRQWLTIISQAIQNGDIVLIEGIGESLDAVLDPILARAFVKRGRTLNIKIGDEEVEFNPKFKLYLQTKLINPHYKPEIAAQCTLINFIVTEGGLEDQLLALVVNREKPELEETRTRLVMSINQLNISLVDLESDLLEKLSNAPDDILSDISLIEGLERTKAAAKDIEQQMGEARVQEIAIDKARNAYRAVAADGSWIYFLLIQLSAIEFMYQYSLESFIFFFFKAMDRTDKVKTIEERVVLLIDMIRVVVFTWVSRGLFERHKLILSSQLCFKLMRKGVLSRTLDQRMFENMLLFPKKVGSENPIEWLPKENWQGIMKMAEMETFAQLPKDMEASPNRFKDWFNSARPEATPLPLDWRKLDDQNPFAKLLVLRALRPDRMLPAITDFVRSTLPRGERFTEVDSSLSFADVLDATLSDSTPQTPIFFILSSGADPMVEMVKLAQRQGYFNGRYWNVSMGQGQDKVAMKCLEEGHKNGHWVVLQNIHLMPRWTLELEKKLDEYNVEGSHPDFRVFLSAEPSEGIPIGILERSIKLTNEPPQGLKANVKRAFATMPRDEFDFKDNKVKCILFALCHFHAVVLERKKFGSGGWNRQYPFSSGDLIDSSTVLFNYLENAGDKVPWDDLRYIFGEIMYGGHVTDDWDRRTVRSYLTFYMKEDLFDDMNLFPFAESFDESFKAPPPMAYANYVEYIDRELRFDTPVAFGMHPNAEIGVKTEQADRLFMQLVELQPRDAGAGAGDEAAASSPQAKLEGVLEHVKRVMEISIDTDLNMSDEDKGPFQNVFLQEIDRMNSLIKEIARSIRELELGLNGELTMSVSMEALQNSLLLYRVPERWVNLAYPSMRALGSWLVNLEDRAKQLSDWTRDPATIPLVTNISYLFNPQSFLTAIMQSTSQKYKLELDKLFVLTEVTRKSASEIDQPPREGAYITGLALDGARWDKEQGQLAESNMKELFCEMPVINAKALLVDKKEKNEIYDCPVYKTQMRGPTFVTTAQLKTRHDPTKWVLAGVVMILDRA